MRILHFIPDIGVSNGVMSFILNYAKAMPEGVIFDVVYFHETEETRQSDIEALGGRVYKIDRPAPGDLFSRKLDSFFNEHKGEWSALHINAPHFAVFIAPSAKRAGIENILVHCHTTEYSLKNSSARNRLLSLYSKYCIKKKLACSEKAGRLWYGNKPFTVINNAIDASAYAYNEEIRQEVRTSLELGESFTVCHIGRTDIPQKNHKFILEVFRNVKMQKPDSKLMLIGAVKTEELSAYAEKLGITDSVLFLGFRSDVARLLQAGDVFLFPSTSEGLPVSLIEAQAAGLPVLMSEAITNEVAITPLVTSYSLSNSPLDWANKLISIAATLRSTPDLPDWDIKNAVEKLLSLYGV